MTNIEQSTKDSIRDLVNDAISAIHSIRYMDISSLEKDKLIKEVQGNLIDIDTMVQGGSTL